MKIFWDVAPCNLVEIDRRFRSAYCLHHQGDGVIVGQFLLNYAAQHPRRPLIFLLHILLRRSAYYGCLLNRFNSEERIQTFFFTFLTKLVLMNTKEMTPVT
jgi:hypothetical protein